MLKNNKKIVIGLVILVACITGIYLLFDRVLNGTIVNWFMDTFMLTTLGKDPETGFDILVQAPYWPNIKRMIFVLFLVLGVIVFIFFLIWTKIVKAHEKSVIVEDIAAYINNGIKSGDENGWAGKYPEIENTILKLYNSNNNTQALIQNELQQKKDLITYLAHDLKTPLAAVVGYLDLLNENPDLGKEERIKCLRIASEKAERLDKLIEEFFDITRFDIQDIVLDLQEVDIALLLNQVIDSFYPDMQKSNRKIITHFEGDLKIDGDSDKLARVFTNVIKNAINYGKKEADISVEANRLDSCVKVCIVNEGAELTQDELKKIFNKFYRLDSSRSGETGGAGLGLAIAERIISAHNGSIKAMSNQGKITFEIMLPHKL